MGLLTEVKVLEGLHSFLEDLGENLFPWVFPGSRGHLLSDTDSSASPPLLARIFVIILGHII